MKDKIIVFDLDGVITSEIGYFLSSAKVCFDFFNTCTIDKYSEIDSINDEYIKMQKIMEVMFVKEKVISIVKNMGVNTNWDLTFIFICITILKNKDKFKEVISDNVNDLFTKSNSDIVIKPIETLHYLSNLYKEKTDVFSHIEIEFEKNFKVQKEKFKRHGEFWNFLYHMFQEIYTKKVIYLEEPIVDSKKIANVLKNLVKKGYTLAIGTGRPKDEAIIPLERWELLKYFDQNRIITYSDVKKAENKYKEILKGRHLAKPDPFVFLKSIMGNEISDIDIINGNYTKINFKDIFVVGDAASDYIASKTIGTTFIGVLTGVNKQDSYTYFKKEKVKYIINSILEIGDLPL